MPRACISTLEEVLVNNAPVLLGNDHVERRKVLRPEAAVNYCQTRSVRIALVHSLRNY
jgi:hypothetical protein